MIEKPIKKKNGIAITSLNTVPLQEPVSKRGYVIIEIKADTGTTGIAEIAVTSSIQQTMQSILDLKDSITGLDALSYNAVYHYLTSLLPHQYTKEIVGIVNALMDIAGKHSNAPVYLLLGGPTRQKIRAMAALTASTEDGVQHAVSSAYKNGFRVFSVPLLLPSEQPLWPSFYANVIGFLQTLREEYGDECDFVLDCGGKLNPAQASVLAKELQPLHLLWINDPCSDTSIPLVKKITEETVTPIGFSRYNKTVDDNLSLLREETVDVIRPDLNQFSVHTVRQLSATAETHYVALAPYHAGSPVSTACGLQAAACIPNFFVQEIPFPNDPQDLEMRYALINQQVERPVDGFIPLPEQPGLGISLNAEAVEKYKIQ